MQLLRGNNLSFLPLRLLPRLVQFYCLLVTFLILTTPAAAATYQPDLLVKLGTEADASYLGAGIYEGTAQMQSRAQATFAGTVAEYRILLRNAGDASDSFLVKGTQGGAGFTAQYLDASGADLSGSVTGAGWTTAVLAPGQSVVLTARVTPTVLTVGASYRVALTAASRADSSRLDQVKTETVVCGSSAAVIVSVPADLAGAPGTVVNYPYTVTNVGSGVNSFALAVTSGAGWSGTLYADDGAGGGVAGDGIRQGGEIRETASTGPLQPGQSYRFFLAVALPPGSSDGSHADSRLSVTGEGTSTSDQVTTTVLAANISVAENVRNLTQGGTFSPSANAYPGDTLEYRMSVTNSGQSPATEVSIDTPLPQNVRIVPGTVWVGSSSEGNGSPCPAAECGTARESEVPSWPGWGREPPMPPGGRSPPGRRFTFFFECRSNDGLIGNRL